MGLWKIRRADGYPDNVVLWRLPEHKLDGKAQFWLHKTKEGVQLMSPEAAEYARSRGFNVSGKVATSIGPSGESVGGAHQQTGPGSTTLDRASPQRTQAATPAAVADCSTSGNLLEKAKCLAKATGVVK